MSPFKPTSDDSEADSPDTTDPVFELDDRALIKAHGEVMRRKMFDDDTIPKPPRAVDEGVMDDVGNEIDLMRDTPPADIIDIDPVAEVDPVDFGGAFELTTDEVVDDL